MIPNSDLARCLEIQNCLFCKAFLNDGIGRLDAKNARKHLSLMHDITSDNLIIGIVCQHEIRKSLYSAQNNDQEGGQH